MECSQDLDTLTNELRIAELKTISFERLREGDDVEVAKLFETCCKDGIFYLDMLGTQPNISETVDDIFALERELFDMPEDELMQYDIDKISPRKLNGYKPLGRNHGELAGRKDGFQSYAVTHPEEISRQCVIVASWLTIFPKIPKDGIRMLGGQADFKRPSIIDTHMSSLHIFTLAISAAASTILSALSSSLKLEPSISFQNVHRSHLPSPDLVRLLKYHAQPLSERGSSHVPHTDLGSMTLLFTRRYGLQIIGSETQEWEWVTPRQGHAIVNVADCLNLLSGQLLRSCRHRVIALPGQAMKERYSFAYFMRPDDGTPMRAVRSPLINDAEQRQDDEVFTSGEWMKRKYAMLRRETWDQNKDWILTGT